MKLQQQGKLEMGGMTVAARVVSREELEAFAAADPAVQPDLLVFEIRPWLAAMEHPRIEE